MFQPLQCTPVITYVLGRRDRETKLLIRGDCFGRIAVWEIPHINENKMKLVRQESFDNLPGNANLSKTYLLINQVMVVCLKLTF